MGAELYYTAPSDEAFEEMRGAALALWQTYDDPYLTDKQGQIRYIKNVQDNFMYIFAMFDNINQRKIVQGLSEETKKALWERMVDGGTPDYYLQMIFN